MADSTEIEVSKLMRFYGVETERDLIAAQHRHIVSLQQTVKDLRPEIKPFRPVREG